MTGGNNEDKILSSYTDLSEAIRFFLHESFRHIEDEIRYYIAAELYGQKLKLIDISDADREVSSGFSSKIKGHLDLIHLDESPLTDETLTRLSNAWTDSQIESELIDLKFKVTQELKGKSLLGHITNFAFVVEILVNRHLFILNLHNEIDSFTFNSLDKASVLHKLLYLFKDEIKKKEINPDRISNLFKLRNFAVHFTRDNSQKFKTTIQELVEIWKEASRLMDVMNKREQISDNDFCDMFDYLREDFIKRFVLKRKTTNR